MKVKMKSAANRNRSILYQPGRRWCDKKCNVTAATKRTVAQRRSPPSAVRSSMIDPETRLADLQTRRCVIGPPDQRKIDAGTKKSTGTTRYAAWLAIPSIL